MVIILMEVIIFFAEMVKIFVEMVINFVEVVINLSEMVRRVAGRIWGIIGRADSVATVKDRTLGAASSVGSIDGVVVVATADYTLINIYKRESQLDRKEYQHHGQKEQHVGRKGLCDGPEN